MIGIRPVSTIERNRNQFIDRLASAPAIGAQSISQFIVTADASTGGVDVSFALTSATGVGSLSLVRAGVNDIKQAVVLQTWAASESTFKWSDTDATLKALGQAFYWIKLLPSSIAGSEADIGPQFILLNPSLVAPLPVAAISASHGAAANGVVLVTVNVSGIPSGDSVKIGVSGYKGNASSVIIAQRAKSPLQFNLEATGETVTLTALAVSTGGTVAASGPTCTLTLNGTATVPAVVQGLTVTQIATGDQVSWPASIEAGVTGYLLYRGQRNDAFGAASLLATIAASGTGTVIYLDTAGLTGDFQYFVVTQSSTGNSAPAGPANPQVLYSSSLVPTNTAANSTNTATLDSLDAGSNVTVRIYGPGGVGTSYIRQMGYGNLTRPGGSIVGLAYATRYYIIYTPGTYLASTVYTDSLPDGYEWVGTITTVAAGQALGTGATATVQFQTGAPFGVQSVTVNTPGFGYGTASATISAGVGAGAALSVYCISGQVISISVTNPGGGYSGGGSVSIVATSIYTGGGGTSGGNGGARYQLAQ